jgi:hypothetical protein
MTLVGRSGPPFELLMNPPGDPVCNWLLRCPICVGETTNCPKFDTRVGPDPFDDAIHDDHRGRTLVDATRQPGASSDLFTRLFRRTEVQLELPLDFPSARRARFVNALKDFGTGFGPRLGAKLLMRIGTPMVAATTPVAIELLAPQYRDNVAANLVAGSALGGVWGAGVGAMLPFGGDGVRISRVKSAGMGAASGMLLAPAVAIASKYVVDWITAPIVRDRDEAEAEVEAANDASEAPPATP